MFEGQKRDYVVSNINPVYANGSLIKIIVNGDQSDAQPLENNETNVYIDGVIKQVVTITAEIDHNGLVFSFESELIIETFELYIDGDKVNLNFL